MVNFMYQLYWAKGDAHIAHKTLFLGVSVRLFLEEIAFEWVDWVRITLSNMGRHHPIHWRPKQNKKVEEGWICSLLELRHSSSPVLRYQCSWAFGLGCGLTPSAPLVFRPLAKTELCHWLSWFSSLQLADHGNSWFPFAWANSHYKFPVTHTHLVGSVSLENCLMLSPLLAYQLYDLKKNNFLK